MSDQRTVLAFFASFLERNVIFERGKKEGHRTETQGKEENHGVHGEKTGEEHRAGALLPLFNFTLYAKNGRGDNEVITKRKNYENAVNRNYSKLGREG